MTRARVPLRRRAGLGLVGVAAAGFLPASAMAQENGDRLAGMRACAALSGDADRLACYDREAAGVLAAVNEGEVRVVERQEIERTRRSLFGFSLPKLDLFGSDSDVPDTLETTITRVRQTGRDAWALQVAEGSIWQINNAPSRFREPEVGQPVVFKKAALGSYFIRVNGQLGVKGRRVE